MKITYTVCLLLLCAAWTSAEYIAQDTTAEPLAPLTEQYEQESEQLDETANATEAASIADKTTKPHRRSQHDHHHPCHYGLPIPYYYPMPVYPPYFMPPIAPNALQMPEMPVAPSEEAEQSDDNDVAFDSVVLTDSAEEVLAEEYLRQIIPTKPTTTPTTKTPIITTAPTTGKSTKAPKSGNKPTLRGSAIRKWIARKRNNKNNKRTTDSPPKASM